MEGIGIAGMEDAAVMKGLLGLDGGISALDRSGHVEGSSQGGEEGIVGVRPVIDGGRLGEGERIGGARDERGIRVGEIDLGGAPDDELGELIEAVGLHSIDVSGGGQIEGSIGSRVESERADQIDIAGEGGDPQGGGQEGSGDGEGVEVRFNQREPWL